MVVPLLLVAACAQQADGPSPTATASQPDPTPSQANSLAPAPTTPPATPVPDITGRPYTPSGPPPKLDTGSATVSLDEVVFDTFRGGYIPLSEASDTVIESLRDAIRPIYEPAYESVEGGDWLKDDDLVIGYASAGASYAYPVRMLNLHEIVNDYIDGVAVLVSYCPLCASGVVYNRELDGQVLLFGNTSALHESDLVMYDHQTGSYWFQVLGEAIVGPLSGKRLEMLPSATVPWGQWVERHPDTLVLSRDLGLGGPSNRYDSNPFVGYGERVNDSGPPFPISPITGVRLLPGDRVFAIQVGDSHKGYALDRAGAWTANDVVGGSDVVVIGRDEDGTAAAAAYFSEVDGRVLTWSLEGGVLTDAETGSEWSDAGVAVSGPLEGSSLRAVPSRTSMWFSLVGALPGIKLYIP
jgi:hypothetical protein